MTGYTLGFCSVSGRFTIGDYELHCGDCFQIRYNGDWRDVRIEHCGKGWYLVGLDPSDCWSHEGAEVRRYS